MPYWPPKRGTTVLALGKRNRLDVLSLKIPELPPCLVAPAQEPADHPAPLLHRRWGESALIAHPCHILIELALVLEHDAGFTPPTEKSKPRSSDADYSSRSGDSPTKAFPLGRDPTECLDIDALRSI
jgi:hypothetical protein